jgi:MoxR-like ATPase
MSGKEKPMEANMRADLEKPYSVVKRLEKRLKRAVKGRDDVIDLILIALLADGHVLLEDYPGSGKTTLAKALGDAIVDDLESDEIAGFRRIQFTPDLLPSDITGVNVFDAETNKFQFRRGPIFAYLVLGDEINRTSPKVQAAMLEAMAEKQVTVDNISWALNEFFFVVATQNPRDAAGTFPLPVAQLDRFLFKIRMDYIDREAEIDVLKTRQLRMEPLSDNEFPKVLRGEVIEARRIIEEKTHVSPAIHACLVDIARSIRSNPRALQGISTRSLVLMLPALKAAAVMRGRDYVSGDDVQWLAPYVFTHRLGSGPRLENAGEIVSDCLKAPLESLSRGTLRP